MEALNLDLIPQGRPPVCHASQYDIGRQIHINLFEGGTEYKLAGTETITLSVRKPDTCVVTAPVTNTSDKYVVIETTQQMTACYGANVCELSIKEGDDVLGSLNFIMAVEQDPLDGGIESASEINDLQAQVDEAVAVSMGNYYTKAETDSALALKADASDVYTKAEADTLLASKANASDVYTKAETDAALALKADKADTYTKEEVDEIVADVYPTKTFTPTPIATITDGAENVPMKSLIVDIMPKQASGTPTPDNPLPISGTNEVVVTHTYGDNETETKTITLPSTVYGGEVDVVSGQGKETQDIFTFSGSESWSYNSTNNFFYTTINSWRDAKQQICITDNGIKMRIVAGTQYANIIRIYISENSDYIDSTTDMNTILTNTTQFAYKLETPTPITTTPTTIKTQGGTESIYSDTGDVSGEYRQSIQGAINDAINSVINAQDDNRSKGGNVEQPKEDTKDEIKEPEEK